MSPSDSPSDNEDLISPRLSLALRILTVVLVAAGLGLGVYFWHQGAASLKSSDARVQGALYSQTARAAGQALEVLVREGDAVDKGQPLVTLQFPELEKQKQEALAALQAAKALQAQVSQGRPGRPQASAGVDSAALARLEQAAQQYQKMQSLYALGGVSAATRDRAAAAYEQARLAAEAPAPAPASPSQPADPAEIRMAQQQVQQAEQRLAALQALEQQRTVVAPTAGIVSLLSVHPGEAVAAGQPLVSLLSATELWLTVRVDASDAARLQLGQTARFSLAELPGQVFQGSIVENAPAAGGQRQPVKVSLPPLSPSPFQVGMQAEVEFLF